ncbi:hypothetical protein [Halosolutus gelatinilyticus]|uniref:hypothetical protein n=1 Tax=Halosolutus gelatinilyticus TaxID=2931975 RepID=UPI001FF6276D|nr:hypothetical protein [Halosolutus gelatinilyticus]
MLAAAEIAMDRDHGTIRESDVRDSFDRAKRMIRKANLRSLPVTHLRLYELLRAVGPIGTELKDVYHEHKEAIFEGEQREPVAWRQAWNYLSKIADYDLVRMPGKTNSKVYEVVDPELEAPVEFEIGDTVYSN